MLICDGFSGNFATADNQDARRSLWAAENNVILPLRPPGGWSCHGQPCDAFHHVFRKLGNTYIDSVLGERGRQRHCATNANTHTHITYFTFKSNRRNSLKSNPSKRRNAIIYKTFHFLHPSIYKPFNPVQDTGIQVCYRHHGPLRSA